MIPAQFSKRATFRPNEVAEITGLSRRTIDRLIAGQWSASIVRVGGSVLVPRACVERLLTPGADQRGGACGRARAASS